MKIGLSFSRCLRDMVDNKVDIKDVLVLITRTDFDPHDDDEWRGIWLGYGGGSSASSDGNPFSRSAPEWTGYTDEARFREVSVALWDSGRLHQPRKFGAQPRRLPYYWLDSVLPSSELDANPAARAAWDKFQTVARLCGVNTHKDHS